MKHPLTTSVKMAPNQPRSIECPVILAAYEHCSATQLGLPLQVSLELTGRDEAIAFNNGNEQHVMFAAACSPLSSYVASRSRPARPWLDPRRFTTLTSDQPLTGAPPPPRPPRGAYLEA